MATRLFFIGTMKQKTITICGKEVQMIYCAATENFFEEISDKSVSIFIPSVEVVDGEETVTLKAKTADWLRLAIAGIVAAYTRMKEEPPVSFDDVIYDATPAERNTMIDAIFGLRNEWYGVSKIVKELLEKDGGEQPKNDDKEKN